MSEFLENTEEIDFYLQIDPLYIDKTEFHILKVWDIINKHKNSNVTYNNILNLFYNNECEIFSNEIYLKLVNGFYIPKFDIILNVI